MSRRCQTWIHWRKSSFSGANTSCAEVADAGTSVWVRDSKHPEAGHLSFTRSELAAFVAAVKAGEIDDLA